MDLYGRVNILRGGSVRLRRGDVREATTIHDDPVARAQELADLGADVIHVVDLDAAAFRSEANRPVIERMIREVGIPVQVAGGVRTEEEVGLLIEAGAWRVVTGTAVIENQTMVRAVCERYPGKIAVAIDVRPDHEVVCHGWTRRSGRYLREVLSEMTSAGAASFLVAEAGRDPLFEPPDFDIIATALANASEPVVAAGGVRDLNDLINIASARFNGRGLDGVIVGRELTHGRFTIPEAKEVFRNAIPIERSPGEAEISEENRTASTVYSEIAERLEAAADHARVASRLCLAGEITRAEEHREAIADLANKVQLNLESTPPNGG